MTYENILINLKSVFVKYAMSRIILVAAIFGISILTAAVGRGGGNFYVPVLVATGIPVHQAATVAQLLLFGTAASALLVFGVRRTVDWKLALVIDPATDLMALVGGYFAHRFSGGTLKIALAALLAAAGVLMFFSVKGVTHERRHGIGWWHRSFAQYSYTVNLWITIPATALIGFISGMVGISGGSFKIPLMVLVCGVPMRIAVGTSSAMVAATALAGFVGHAAGGDVVSTGSMFLLAAVAVVGGLLGGVVSLKTKPERLKTLFAVSTLMASAFMVFNVWTTH